TTSVRTSAPRRPLKREAGASSRPLVLGRIGETTHSLEPPRQDFHLLITRRKGEGIFFFAFTKHHATPAKIPFAFLITRACLPPERACTRTCAARTGPTSAARPSECATECSFVRREKTKTRPTARSRESCAAFLARAASSRRRRVASRRSPK